MCNDDDMPIHSFWENGGSFVLKEGSIFKGLSLHKYHNSKEINTPIAIHASIVLY